MSSVFPYHVPTPLATSSGQERLMFLRKVYSLFLGGIVSAVAGAVIALYAGGSSEVIALGSTQTLQGSVPPIVAWVAQHWVLSSIVYIASIFLCGAVRRVPVVNAMALFGFTFVSGLYIAPMLFLANALGATGQALTVHPVRDAFALTAAAFTGLTAYAWVSKRDFSFLGGFLSIGSIVLLVALLLNLWVGGQVFYLAISSVGVLLFSLYVLYDTWRILQSNEELDSPVSIALSLFLDFTNLFIFILRIFMGRQRD